MFWMNDWEHLRRTAKRSTAFTTKQMTRRIRAGCCIPFGTDSWRIEPFRSKDARRLRFWIAIRIIASERAYVEARLVLCCYDIQTWRRGCKDRGERPNIGHFPSTWAPKTTRKHSSEWLQKTKTKEKRLQRNIAGWKESVVNFIR